MLNFPLGGPCSLSPTRLAPYITRVNRPLTPILFKSIAIYLPFLSRYFCKSLPSAWQEVVYTPPICITMRLPFVSREIFAEVLESEPSRKTCRECLSSNALKAGWPRFGSVTVWGWNSLSGSGLRFPRFL